ncbi:putative ribosome-binding factor A, mitochondrial [Astyanax mexicanus]|uniref:putative ribosome-binding factor A, mitochondrial n=1 Tax=Astyanax mexicanus TaxID=7994 RepID=UPI0020CB3A3D|nr:putative ribosome-binding factor A, mitochondrial [Astyanax mexicanus]
MLAVNSQYWIQKCALSRYCSGVLAVLSGLKPEPQQQQQQQKSRPGVLNFHSSAVQNRNLLMKMLEKKKKRRWYETPQPVITTQSAFLTPVKKKKDQQDSRRVRTLNIIVYKAVVDLLSSHEINADLHSYSVEITKVSFTADYTSCRIYWKTSWSEETDLKIQQLLDRSAPRIRYLIMSLQILGNVPPLTFVRDRKYAALKEVENLLEIADYGPREDDLSFAGKDADTRLHTTDPVEKKKALWLNIDQDALYKQIEDYKQRSSVSSSEITSSPGLTQEQLDLLAEIRKQKLIEKKKRKSKKLKDDYDDDDTSPKAFLIARQLELEEQKEQEKEEQHRDQDVENSEVSELINDYDRKH